MLPILYSFRRCPYAIRARMAIRYAGLNVQLREVVLRNKPTSMLEYSAKGTVPVLVLNGKDVIDESRDVMGWALAQSDPEHWLSDQNTALIDENDFVFKKHLDRYKYAVRFPEQPMSFYRSQAEEFLIKLEGFLEENKFLCSDQVSFTDVAIFPFIRQFAFVDKDWFDQTSYSKLQNWLVYFLESDLFLQVMKKYPAWQEGDDIVVFP